MLVIACAYLVPAVPAAAMTAQETFEDGNRLFRDDLYWAALLRYRQAFEAGMNSPALHFNMGVAHYRAKQHIRARASLLKAVQSPSLRVVSHYNLGLNAYAAGDSDDALNWFRQARDQQENPQIRRLAIIAISRIQTQRRARDPIVVHEKKEREERALGEFSLQALVGFGSDDNVYRAPGLPYIDYAVVDPATGQSPLVLPEEISGAFMPFEIRTRYDVNAYPFESFFGEYRLAGRYYQDKELDAANEFSHELRFGSEFERKRENKSTHVYSAFTIAQHDETYFDPDDGTERFVLDPLDGPQLVGERLNYVRFGPQFSVRRSYKRLAIGLRFKGQVWDYTDTDVVPEYDHEYFNIGANIQYRFTPTSLLRFTVDKSVRRFGDRPSFDLDAQQLITNPSLRYDYLEYGLLARQKLLRNMWFGFGYEYTNREDRYVGYNDYNRDTYKFEFSWSPGRRFQIDYRGYYRVYDFANAFAFNNPSQAAKTLETAQSRLTATYRMTRRLSLVAEARIREASSNDIRIGYDRNWYSLGVTWQE